MDFKDVIKQDFLTVDALINSGLITERQAFIYSVKKEFSELKQTTTVTDAMQTLSEKHFISFNTVKNYVKTEIVMPQPPTTPSPVLIT